MAAIRELDVEAFLRTRLRTIVAGPRRVESDLKIET